MDDHFLEKVLEGPTRKEQSSGPNVMSGLTSNPTLSTSIRQERQQLKNGFGVGPKEMVEKLPNEVSNRVHEFVLILWPMLRVLVLASEWILWGHLMGVGI